MPLPCPFRPSLALAFCFGFCPCAIMRLLPVLILHFAYMGCVVSQAPTRFMTRPSHHRPDPEEEDAAGDLEHDDSDDSDDADADADAAGGRAARGGALHSPTHALLSASRTSALWTAAGASRRLGSPAPSPSSVAASTAGRTLFASPFPASTSAALCGQCRLHYASPVPAPVAGSAPVPYLEASRDLGLPSGRDRDRSTKVSPHPNVARASHLVLVDPSQHEWAAPAATAPRPASVPTSSPPSSTDPFAHEWLTTAAAVSPRDAAAAALIQAEEAWIAGTDTGADVSECDAAIDALPTGSPRGAEWTVDFDETPRGTATDEAHLTAPPPPPRPQPQPPQQPQQSSAVSPSPAAREAPAADDVTALPWAAYLPGGLGPEQEAEVAQLRSELTQLRATTEWAVQRAELCAQQQMYVDRREIGVCLCLSLLLFCVLFVPPVCVCSWVWIWICPFVSALVLDHWSRAVCHQGGWQAMG